MQQFDTISVISQNERSTVSLVSLADSDSLAVFKQRKSGNMELLELLRALDSPHIPKIYELEQHEDEIWILEEHLCGRTLREKLDPIDTTNNAAFNATLESGSPTSSISSEEFLQLTEAIGQALLFLHSLTPAIIFRDLKPENIFLTDDGRVVLIDFDAAREFAEDSLKKYQDTVLLGTRSYAAPEQYGFAQTDVRTDIYSYGIVIQEIYERTICPRWMERRLQKIQKKATMFAPENRYQTIQEVLEDITMLRTGFTKKHIPFIVLIAVAIYLTGIGSGIAITKLSESGVLNNHPVIGASDATLDIFNNADSVGGNVIYYDIGNGRYSFGGFPDSFQPSIVMLPNTDNNITMTSIADYALAGRPALVAVYIPEGYTSIGAYTFMNNANLATVFIPDSVVEFYDNIFDGCENVTIFCHKGSAAEEYAIKYGIPYALTLIDSE